jgi:aerobic-type carbon monoxide dehydrogenase small subunit (CoxS/CutS family)
MEKDMPTARRRQRTQPPSGETPLAELRVNGDTHQIPVRPGATLVEVLRDELGLRGTKLACGRGECGACTVLVDGRATLACITFASRVHGHVETIEGIAGLESNLRAAFADTGAFQCGYCTPGQVVRAAGMLRSGSVPADDQELRHQMAGNICRCTGYQAIIEAVRSIADGTAAAS